MNIIFEPKFSSFLIKVTAMCNLNCNYCYVFNHADQSWKSLPARMSDHSQDMVADRIAEYAREKQLQYISIIFHGGEPLLIGAPNITNFAAKIKNRVPAVTKIDFCIQTNGTLLKEQDVELLVKENMQISLSLDGPKEVNDIHRVTHKGNSSFDKVLRGYKLLQKYPKNFSGVISVINPTISPRVLFEFFDPLLPPSLDFLLPDANYMALPPGRDKNPNLYIDWLLEAFDLWLTQYSHIKMRFFDQLILSHFGYKSRTDAFGFGDITMLTIETDGSYHDLDVLKITREGQSKLNKNVFNSSIYEISTHNKIQEHRKLLNIDGLSYECQTCSVVGICGGGSVPHRYDGKGFKNPTIYCHEMLSLINHVKNKAIPAITPAFKVEQVLKRPNNQKKVINIIASCESLEKNKDFDYIYTKWCDKSSKNFRKALEYARSNQACSKETLDHFESLGRQKVQEISLYPLTQCWTTVTNAAANGGYIRDPKMHNIMFDCSYLDYIKDNQTTTSHKPYIHPYNLWVQQLFGSHHDFEDENNIEKTKSIIHEALNIIKFYKPNIYKEIGLISTAIMIVKNPNKQADNFISFSDNLMPGALLISILSKGNKSSPYIIAESILHEHRRQKMYILENFVSLVCSEIPYVRSPWKDFPSPISSLLQAVYVFYELYQYWNHIKISATNGNDKKYAVLEIENIHGRLTTGLNELLNSKQNLTADSIELIEYYKAKLKSD